MNRKFKNGMLMAAAFLSAMFVNTACTEEWDDHYDDNGTNAGKVSILDVIKADTELSDFCEVLGSLDEEGVNLADSLLNQSRVYTLWAPVNGTFNKDSLINAATIPDTIIEAKNVVDDVTGEMVTKYNTTYITDRHKVLIRFVESHIANYLYTASGTMDDDNFILLINQKMVPFTGNAVEGYKFDGDSIDAAGMNIRAGNGLIHKIIGTVDYGLNLWEYLEDAADADSVAKFLYSFNNRKFDEWSSIEGPTVQGEKTYLDSVFTNSNQWLSMYGDKYTAGFGDVTKEDSSFMMFVPSNQVWGEMVPEIEKLYNYYTKKGEDTFIADSLRWFYSRKALLNYMLFSNNDKLKDKATGMVRTDSMLSTYKMRRRIFDAATVMDGVREGVECSNGTFYIRDNYKYHVKADGTDNTRFYLWHDTIQVEAENVTYQGSTSNSKVAFATSCNVNTRYVSKNEINLDTTDLTIPRSMTYVEAIGVASTSNPALLWTIPEVLSGSYYVGVVMVPEHVSSKNLKPEDSKPNIFTLEVQSNTGNGTSKSLVKTKDLENNPLAIDTVWVGTSDGTRTKVKFDYTEYGFNKEEFLTTVKITSNVPRRGGEGYDRKLRVDFVILEPVEDDVE